MSTALAKFAAETATNGPLHLTGARPGYIKIIWLVAMLVSTSYCMYKLYGAYQRFVSGEFTTTVKANELDFEFPDIFFCNENPISGSYSVTLSEEDYAVLRHYKKLVNDSMSGIVFSTPEERTVFYATRLVNTVPYQFLSDKLGNREEQIKIFYFFNGKDTVNMTKFHHPSMVNCFGLNFTERDIRLLQNPSSSVQIAMFLDLQLSAPYDNNTEDDMVALNWGQIELNPNNWDFNYGMDFTIASGIRIFITPNGEYPSELGLAISVEPGSLHLIRLKMQDIHYSEDDLPRKCDNTIGPDADFLNPYSGEKQNFKYSQAVCWYREVARLSMEVFNCSIWRYPVPWEYRSQAQCYNLTQFPGNQFYTKSTTAKKHEILQNATEACANKIPCHQRVYSYVHSSSHWPSDDDWKQYYRGYVTQITKSSFTPALSYLVNNGSYDEVKSTMLQLALSADEYKSEEVQLSLAYTFDSLIADFGGLLGLFLGMSMMSIMELLELLHDCVVDLWQQTRRPKRRVTVINVAKQP